MKIVVSNVAKTKSPTLSTVGMFEDNIKLRQVVSDISTNLGHAITIQDEAGRAVPIRLNSASGNQESFVDGNWTPVSTTTGLSGTKIFTDGAAKTHTVVIKNGLITSWNIA